MSSTLFDIEIEQEILAPAPVVSRRTDGGLVIRINPAQNTSRNNNVPENRLRYLREQGLKIADKDPHYSYFSDSNGLHYVLQSQY